MRKQTTARTRKRPTASSSERSGLIAKNQTEAQSAGAKPTLDNRSHRTITGSNRLDLRIHIRQLSLVGARNSYS